MPELTENTTGGKIVQKFVEVEPAPDRTLKALYADPTTAEVPTHPETSPGSKGQVYELSPLHPRRFRGEGGLYPWMYIPVEGSKAIPISERNMVLVGAVLDARNYILKFVSELSKKECWVQIRPLTHTVVQIFTIEQWERSIMPTNKDRRGFKVAIAFQFQRHVMSFLSLDMLFNIFWERSRLELPVQCADVYLEPERFLTEVTSWMQERRKGRKNCILKPKARKGNAMTIVRESLVFHGLSPDLTEEDLFDSPSRTARLCAAFYHFAHAAHHEVWDLTQQHMHGYVVAASVKDRQKYSKMLHVWGKDRTYLSERQARLLDARNDGKTKFDAFEPELCRYALTRPTLNLGALIFGPDLWKTLSVSQGLPASTLLIDNPLAKHFTKIGVNSKFSGLDKSTYTFLFHESNVKRSLSKTWRKTYCYRKGCDIWTLYKTPCFDSIEGKEREERLLSFVTQHRNIYTVGPLDYCGISKLVHGRGEDKMLVCDYDPNVPAFYTMRRVLQKETIKLKGKGTEHSGISIQLKRKLEQDFCSVSEASSLSSLSTPRGFSNSASAQDIPADPERPRKRIRRSADRDLLNSMPILPPAISTHTRITRHRK